MKTRTTTNPTSATHTGQHTRNQLNALLNLRKGQPSKEKHSAKRLTLALSPDTSKGQSPGGRSKVRIIEHAPTRWHFVQSSSATVPGARSSSLRLSTPTSPRLFRYTPSSS